MIIHEISDDEITHYFLKQTLYLLGGPIFGSISLKTSFEGDMSTIFNDSLANNPIDPFWKWNNAVRSYSAL